MTTYQELLKQRESLEKQIQEARKTELAATVATVRQLVQEYALTEADVFGSHRSKQVTSEKRTVAPKYRNSVTGDTWTGRGKAPKWIEGKDRDQFLINA